MHLVGSLILAGAVIVVVVVPLLAVWVPVRAMRGRARLRRAIEVQGYRIRRMELRWLTRGPFADMRPAGLKFADWLYRAAAEDRDGNPRVAWIRWRPGMPWQPEDRWELRWDESPDLKPRGLPTVVFGGVILAGTVVAIMLIFGAARNRVAARVPVHDDIAQRFVCERSHTNYAWGYRHAGIYVDREGGVYRFSVQTRTLPQSAESDRTEAEMEAKYGASPMRIGTVPREQLLAMFRLIPAAANGQYSKRVSAGADRGAEVSACYVVDSDTQRYREVVLDVKGDWEYRNLTSEAQTLAAWLDLVAQAPARR